MLEVVNRELTTSSLSVNRTVFRLVRPPRLVPLYNWLPGETIPTFVPDSPIASSTPTQHTTSAASIAQQNLLNCCRLFRVE